MISILFHHPLPLRRTLRAACALLLAAMALTTGAIAAANPPAKPLILIYGDSLSAEYGLKRGAGWVALLQDRLAREGFPHRIMNVSISGETTAGGLSRLDAALKKHQPSLVLLQLGANDGLRGLAIGQTRRNLAEMIDRARAQGAAVLLIGIRIPPNYGPDYSRQFDSLFGQLAGEKQVPMVPFLLDGLADNPLMFQADTIHPNEKAQPTMLRNVWSVLSTAGLLQAARSTAGPAATPTHAAAAASPAAPAVVAAGRVLEFSDIAQEGELRFLTQHPEPDSYRYESRVRVGADSFDSGIIELSTCHYQLDPIRKIVIAFNPNRLQDLSIKSTQGIGAVEIKGHHVVMADVQRGASICIDLRSKALDRIDQQTYRLQAGPLMRRYLDGYLPMQAKLTFEWPEAMAALHQTQPVPQPGVKLSQHAAGAELTMVFAGRLLAAIDLRRK